MEKDKVVSKRIGLTKENYKKIKISIEALEIDKKETIAINDVANEAIEFFFKEKIVPMVIGE